MKKPTLMQITSVAVADVDARKRLRPVSSAGVESLVASIKETQVMKDAIHVRQMKSGAFVLIAGAHRLEAARQLGWDQIEAKVWTGVTDDWARLMEIDDNLAGAEMNALDTAVFLSERKAIYEKLHPETRAGIAGAAARWDASDVASFASSTAEKFGWSKRQVERVVAAGKALTKDEVRWLRSAPNPVKLADLQALARAADPHARSQACIALSNGTAKSAVEALKAQLGVVEPTVQDPVEATFKALSNAWNRAPMAAKKRFLLEHASEIWEAQNKGVPLNRWSEADE